MKKITYLLIFTTINIFSQQEELQNQFKLEYNLLGVGASYELPISENWLLDVGVGVGGGVDADNGYVWQFNSNLAFYFKGEMKYYYNREKRVKKNKNNINNAGNYFALQTKYFTRRFSPSEDFIPLQNSLLTEVHWGLQRSLGGYWLFNFHVGLGVLRNLENNTGIMSPSIGLKFSYKLF
ncbi:hypothetical protein [Polaribacter tangerinus]|uniref:hypothetical protein n=1 Tax=Polaribacter tangerinus TaxID=1920034 RepID=UPI000B4A7D39|nr:hypothetical protein [Polaribacter tangerinus]